MKGRILGLMGLALLLMAGCGPTAFPTQADGWTKPPASATASAPTPQATAGLANPASQYCLEKGGRSDIRTNADGSQAGYCLFPDGSECEEWAFYRGECAPGGQATPATSPAAVSEEELQALVLATLPPGAFEEIRVLALASPSSVMPLWAVSSVGMRNYDLDPAPGHFVAIYTHKEGGWQELARVDLSKAGIWATDGVIPDGLSRPASPRWPSIPSASGSRWGAWPVPTAGRSTCWGSTAPP